MSIVKAKCANCGAEFAVDNSKEGSVCPFCNTPYIAEKAINRNDTTNIVGTNNENAIDEACKEFEIVSGRLVKYLGSSTDVVIPDNVVIIGRNAFFGCNFIKIVVIPAGVTKIGESAFYNCSSLKSVIIPNGVVSIGAQAFKQCSSLISITIPDSVTEIGKEAFRSCTSLKSLNIGKNINIMGEDAFSDCENLENVQLLPEKKYLKLSWKKWANNTKWCKQFEAMDHKNDKQYKIAKIIFGVFILVTILFIIIGIVVTKK